MIYNKIKNNTREDSDITEIPINIRILEQNKNKILQFQVL